MMLAREAFVLALVVVAGGTVACGGEAEGDGHAAASGGVATGGAGGAYGGSGGSGGGAGSGCGEVPPIDCVPTWCGGDVVVARVCDAGSWRCPEGEVPRSECPSDACFHGPVYGCCDALGNFSTPTCPGQAAEVCAAGSYLTMSFGPFCPPAGLFPCGSQSKALTCKLGAEYCRKAAGASDSWTCEPLPSACGSTPSCACLAPVACGSCNDAGIGAVTLYCAS